MAKIKPGNFKKEHGYSRAGSVLMSKSSKADAQKRQARLNAFSSAQNKQVADTVERNVDVPAALKKGAKLTEEGYYEGDQRYKPTGKRKAKIMPRFRHFEPR